MVGPLMATSSEKSVITHSTCFLNLNIVQYARSVKCQAQYLNNCADYNKL